MGETADGAEDSETAEIEEEEVPLGQKDMEEEGGSALPWVAGGAAVVAAGAGAGWYFYRKRKS